MLVRFSALRSLALACLASLALCGYARALTVDRPGVDDLLFSSGLIFEAEAVEVDAAAGGTHDPRTRVTLTVIDILAGTAAATGERFEFEVPEGLLPDGRFVELVGAPRFAPGIRYLVFYRQGPWYLTPIVGWSHGLLRRVGQGSDAIWVGADGRCVAGVERRGLVPGPAVAAAAPPSAGLPAITGAAPSPDPPATPTHCLGADRLRHQLVRRLAELRHAPEGPVERRPRAGGWPLAPADGDAP